MLELLCANWNILVKYSLPLQIHPCGVLDMAKAVAPKVFATIPAGNDD